MAQPAYMPVTVPETGTVTEIAAGLFWLRMPLPFELNHINLWLLDDGDGWVIVDTGVDLPEVRAAWERLFAEFMGGRPVKRVLVTHMHPDHFGLAGWLTERWRAPLYMTAEEYLTGRVLSGPPKPFGWEARAFLRRAGFDEADIDEAEGLNYGQFGAHVSRPPESFRRLNDRDRLVIGGREWRVVVGRGHSPEHACFHCPELGVLISGDQVLPRISSNVGIHALEPTANPLKLWLQSLDRFKRLPEHTRVLPAHGEPFTGLHGRLNALIHGHEERLRLAHRHIREPRSVMECIPFIFRRKLSGFPRLMAMGEALAHLELLVDRGLARAEDGADGVRRFVAVEDISPNDQETLHE